MAKHEGTTIVSSKGHEKTRKTGMGRGGKADQFLGPGMTGTSAKSHDRITERIKREITRKTIRREKLGRASRSSKFNASRGANIIDRIAGHEGTKIGTPGTSNRKDKK